MRRIKLSPGGQIMSRELYGSNTVSSTKYTLISFLPLSLMHQLANVIHIFYLANAYLQSMPSISTNSFLATLIPISWVMLLGILFELISDLRRWQSDKIVNA